MMENAPIFVEMAKKRQQDFARVQLKPGRLLSKRRNITSAKFKSRKIIMPKEKLIKIKAEFTIADCIKKIKSSGSEKDKIGQLNELNKLVHRQPDSLNTHLSQIFETVLDYLRDPYDGVRSAALKAIIAVLEVADDLQLHNFSDLLCGTILAIMKNPNQKITPASLILLDCMLKNHPYLICHNITLIYDLLPSEKRHFTRKMTNVSEKETYQYSEIEDINSLGHINSFLKSILMLHNTKDVATDQEEDKVVYMDEKSTMSLALYAGGGLQPINIEKANATQFYFQADPFDEVGKLTPILDALIKLIPNHYRQIFGKDRNTDNSLRCDSISDLNILIQLLCNVATLAEKISVAYSDKIIFTDVEKEIADFLSENVFTPNRKNFPIELHLTFAGTSLQPLVMLNTSLCFLYMKFLSSKDNCDDNWEFIERYFRKFFSYEKTYSSDLKCRCIPLFIKMIDHYSFKTEVPDVIHLLLKQLVLLLKTRINHPNKKMLIDFLCNMSLLPEYKFWVESESIELWYEWLSSFLLKENSHKLDKKIMRMICKIGKLRHPSFIKHLDFNALKHMLKHSRNDDVRETAIFMLHNMDIDGELLKNVYDIVCRDSFTTKSTITLIHMLNVRFNECSPSNRPYVDYIAFLLNIAIDTYNVDRSRWINLEVNEVTKGVQYIQDSLPYCIVPSLHWKEHSELFKVCLTYLRNLPMAPMGIMFLRAVKELLDNNEIIPIHCVLAIMKLDMPELKDKNHRLLMLDINYSCLMTISVLTQTPIDDEWHKWNVTELMDTISFTGNLAIRTLELLDQGRYGDRHLDGFIVYNMLRVVKVFIDKNLINYEFADEVELLLQVVTSLAEERCSDKMMKHQPLYIYLYNYIFKHY